MSELTEPQLREIKRTPLVEWQRVMAARGTLDCKFVCPSCGLTSSPNDFKALGVDPERAAKECIGRHDPERGCDWAAYGLFRGPEFVLHADGSESPVFAFAEVPADV